MQINSNTDFTTILSETDKYKFWQSGFFEESRIKKARKLFSFGLVHISKIDLL
jgi:hypothetical protein